MNRWASIFLLVFLSGCEEPVLQAVGQLESERIELVVEFSEAIIAIDVSEGDELSSGNLLIQQDTSRADIRILDAEANIARINALLEEQLAGPRSETIDVARANVAAAEIEKDYRNNEAQRLDGLRARNLTSVESADAAANLSKAAGAKLVFVSAQLAEIQAGTRYEKIQQTRALLLQAQAQLSSLELDRQRLSIVAPVDSMVDSLPFEIGGRPRPGDVVAVLLSGEQPYARVYIPEAVRIQFRPGSTLQISVDGLDRTLTGTVRRIASEPSFTPYFALTERDRGRLSYVAEITLPQLPQRLPDGVPVQAILE
ncbi:MAG: hypothetical protein COA96_10950 [SAR86 cluster bacterium]|uniref:YbhG-like alpha-helical hairpin domain-containing protein n=1 Tax=SAR86 cluster bacterium TaxID=2030880 RepID=A0A2A5AXC6_9GAMM|nr:MAG: hypothetical protein COA96_10950 [SAR86 cluster bacterium]